MSDSTLATVEPETLENTPETTVELVMDPQNTEHDADDNDDDKYTSSTPTSDSDLSSDDDGADGIDFYDNDDWDETGEDSTQKPNLPDRRKTVFALPSVSNLTKLDSALSSIFLQNIKPVLIAQTKHFIQSRLGTISLEFEQLVSQCAAAIDEFQRLEDLLVASPGTFEEKLPLINDSLAKVGSTITGLFSELKRSHNIILAANAPLTEQESSLINPESEEEPDYIAASSRWSTDSNRGSTTPVEPYTSTRQNTRDYQGENQNQYTNQGRKRAKTFHSPGLRSSRPESSSVGFINTKNPSLSKILQPKPIYQKPRAPTPKPISSKITDLSGFTTMERHSKLINGPRVAKTSGYDSGHLSNNSISKDISGDTDETNDTGHVDNSKISSINLPEAPVTPTSSHGRRDSLASNHSIFETTLPAAGNLYSSMKKKMAYVGTPQYSESESTQKSTQGGTGVAQENDNNSQGNFKSSNYPTRANTIEFTENPPTEESVNAFSFSDDNGMNSSATDQLEEYSNILESDLVGKPQWIQTLILEPAVFPTEDQIQSMERCLVRWSYTAVLEDELSLEKGEIIYIISRTNSVDPLWWLGYSPRSKQKGRIPFNYCRLLQTEPRKSVSHSSGSSGRKSSTLTSNISGTDLYVGPTNPDDVIDSSSLPHTRSQSDIVKSTQPNQNNSQYAKNAVIYNQQRPNSQTTLMAGFLWKKGAKGHNFKNWRNRHFQLHPKTLLYFKQPFSPEPLGRLPLTNCTLVKDASSYMSSKDQKNYPYAFQLQMAKKSWVLASPDPENLNQWYKMLSEAIEACKS